MSRYDAVIFDFSGVMVASAFDALADIAPDHPKEEVLELLLGPYHEDTDHHWHQVERGEISIFDWITWVTEAAEEAGIELDLSKMASLLGQLHPHDSMIEVARAAKAAGLGVGLLTNNVAEGSDHWREVIPVDDLFDDVVDSSAVGLRKPNPAIYELALERLGGIAPERAIFLDDAEGNIAGAERVGLTTIHVTDPDAAAAELRDLLQI